MEETTAANITNIGRPNMDSIAAAGISISFMIILFVMGFDRKTEGRTALLHVFYEGSVNQRTQSLFTDQIASQSVINMIRYKRKCT